jgi:hypothetical protein
MELDDLLEKMRAESGAASLDADTIIAAALARRATRLSPALLASAGVFALLFGVGAGIGSSAPAAADATLVPLVYSPSTVLLGD